MRSAEIGKTKFFPCSRYSFPPLFSHARNINLPACALAGILPDTFFPHLFAPGRRRCVAVFPVGAVREPPLREIGIGFPHQRARPNVFPDVAQFVLIRRPLDEADLGRPFGAEDACGAEKPRPAGRESRPWPHFIGAAHPTSAGLPSPDGADRPQMRSYWDRDEGWGSFPGERLPLA